MLEKFHLHGNIEQNVQNIFVIPKYIDRNRTNEKKNRQYFVRKLKSKVPVSLQLYN